MHTTLRSDVERCHEPVHVADTRQGTTRQGSCQHDPLHRERYITFSHHHPSKKFRNAIQITRHRRQYPTVKVGYHHRCCHSYYTAKARRRRRAHIGVHSSLRSLAVWWRALQFPVFGSAPCSRNKGTMYLASSPLTAYPRADIPRLLSTALTGTPASSNSFGRPTFLAIGWLCNAVSPRLLMAVRSDQEFKSIVAVSTE
jgi:hypothetical protein